jgi:hypothetical protein
LGSPVFGNASAIPERAFLTASVSRERPPPGAGIVGTSSRGPGTNRPNESM